MKKLLIITLIILALGCKEKAKTVYFFKSCESSEFYDYAPFKNPPRLQQSYQGVDYDYVRYVEEPLNGCDELIHTDKRGFRFSELEIREIKQQ